MSRGSDIPNWYSDTEPMNADIMQDDSVYEFNAYDSSGQRSEDESSSTSTSSSEQNYKVMTFKNGTDVNTIPIQKDGMAVCEKCGAIGVKHAFYSKSKRFCSLACSRSYISMEREGKPIPKPKPMFKVIKLTGLQNLFFYSTDISICKFC